MYIFELIAKLIKNKNKHKTNTNQEHADYDPICSHTFLPIDSTCETLACSKCGLIVKSKDMNIKEENPFGQ